MRVTLLHNPNAGDGDLGRKELVSLLEAVGFDVKYKSAKARDYERALKDPGDLVVVAGGDGTVAKIATRMAGRGIPLAIVPGGTANNIASTLGLPEDPRELIAALPTAVRRPLNVGVASARWGDERFVEGVGVGVFAQLLSEKDPPQPVVERGKKGRRGPAVPPAEPNDKFTVGLAGLLRALRDHEPRHWRITADGRDVSGRYLLAAVMNTRYLGAGVPVAAGADPGDGWLDLALLDESRRDGLVEYLEYRLAGEPAVLRADTMRARQVRIEWRGGEGHVDDELWPGVDTIPEGAKDMVTIELLPAALEVLVPATRNGAVSGAPS